MASCGFPRRMAWRGSTRRRSLLLLSVFLFVQGRALERPLELRGESMAQFLAHELTLSASGSSCPMFVDAVFRPGYSKAAGNSDFSNVRVMPHSTAPNKAAEIEWRWRKLGAPANHPEFPLCLPGRQPGLRRERNWGLGNLGTKSPLRNREHEIGASKTFAFRRVAVGGARISISNI